MNDIKARIKSVESTMQITKAMELVATSKLRRARENVERARPFYEILGQAIDVIRSAPDFKDVFGDTAKSQGKTLFIVIAGDRGLAGGYNSNVFKMTEQLAKDKNAVFLPIGKKAGEYLRRREKELFSDISLQVNDVGVGESFKLAADICKDFFDGDLKDVYIVYTKFVSMISQLPVYEQLLPLEREASGDGGAAFDPIIEEEPCELLMKILPEYTGGIIYSAVCEAFASECGARRSAMNAANKNAGEMIDMLMLKYNRARQAVITQEITEIVSGAEAL